MGVTGLTVPYLTDNIYASLVAKVVMAAVLYTGIMAACRVQTFRESWAYFHRKKQEE